MRSLFLCNKHYFDILTAYGRFLNWGKGTVFRGSLPTQAQAIIYRLTNENGWNCPIQVLCSGNLTIEKMLYAAGYRDISSNDVLLYTTAIGRYFAGEKIGMEPIDRIKKEHSWVWKYNGSEEDKLANVLLLSSFANILERNNEYYRRQKRQYIKQWDTLHGEMVRRIKANPVRIKRYYLGDALDVIKEVSKDTGIITFPPFFGAGGNFENDFKSLERLYDWNKPEFQRFDEEALLAFFNDVMGRKHWIIGTNERVEFLEKHLVGFTRTTNRGVPIYLYSGQGTAQICMPKQETESILNDKLGKYEDIGNKMTLSLLSYKQFQAARSQYMNINIRPGSATQAIAVLVDGKLIGVYAISAAPTSANWAGRVETPTIYMLSDFPVMPTKYKRLAKLVLYAALSEEGQIIAQKVSNKRIRSMITTAFTNNPVSMKYRGIFELLTRKENTAFNESWGKDIDKSNEYYAQRYSLNYGARMGEWTLRDGLRTWKKKHGKAIAEHVRGGG